MEGQPRPFKETMQLKAKLRGRLGGRCGGGVGVWWQRSKNIYSLVLEIMENRAVDTKTKIKVTLDQENGSVSASGSFHLHSIFSGCSA